MRKSIWILLAVLTALTIGSILGCTTPEVPGPTEEGTLLGPTNEPANSETPETPTTDNTENETMPKPPEYTVEDRIEFLKGKYVSILGDSISTYEGVSNVGTTNTTIAGYNAFYNGDWKNILTSTNETYWGMVISKYQMELLVNNSCGGNRLINASGTGGAVPAGYLRIENLAADTGELKGTKPDIIFSYMGTNDFIAKIPVGELTDNTFENVRSGNGYITPTTFIEAYIITLDKASKLYPDAQIFVFTLLPTHYNMDWSLLNKYNARIRQLTTYYENVVLVDIAAYSGITTDNYAQYTFDRTHPNLQGFAAIADDLEKALLNNWN